MLQRMLSRRLDSGVQSVRLTDPPVRLLRIKGVMIEVAQKLWRMGHKSRLGVV